MKDQPLRTTVIGSYPFPGWLEYASAHLDEFGPDDILPVLGLVRMGLDPQQPGTADHTGTNLAVGLLAELLVSAVIARTAGMQVCQHQGIEAPRTQGAEELCLIPCDLVSPALAFQRVM